VVRSVSKDIAIVDMEGGMGRVLLSNTTWAHEPDHTQDARRVKKLASLRGVVKEGDVIWGKVTSLNEGNIYTVLLKQYPVVQGALVCLDPETGFIRAMVGGYDFTKTKFNLAVQAKRQPGSAFKPIIYSAALEKGLTPASVFVDSPVIFEDEDKKNWKPRNFEMRFYGPVTLRDALTHSRNVVTVKLLQQVGLNYVVNYANRFKLGGRLKADMSLALGTSEVTPLELTAMYGVFANKGVYVEPMAVNYITDRTGDIIEVNTSEPEQIISRENAFLMASMLQSVVQHGTGRRAKVLNRPTGGKTGTTNDFVDAWFVGFTPGLSTAVWIGKDFHTPMGKNETGSRAASPIWVEFMKQALKGTPVQHFEVPENIVFKKINKKNGLLALPSDPEAVLESFMVDRVPVKYSEEEGQSRETDYRL
ncbi:MAG: penicillin-binding transpeptidase domain-containing protein, partial [Nitrospinota bacterium]